MTIRFRFTPQLAVFALLLTAGMNGFAAERVVTSSGAVEGKTSADGKISIFEGIPYAAPPVGPLRWRAPQPIPAWKGVRKAVAFGPRCMQGRIYSDMVFRDDGPSEDCLYLNVWTPAARSSAPLPVMMWIYGGGFAAGSASEPRQDGEKLAEKGVVVVSFNYRLGVFGFFSHPDLAKESGHNAAGNYGLLDQVAALQWIHRNIGAFGGDAGNVTIFGESAGSFSVSALMASPLAQGLFQHAIGESGAFFGRSLHLQTLAQSEATDRKFAQTLGTDSLTALRAKPAEDLLQAALNQKAVRFSANIDGYFLPESPLTIYLAGRQSHVPLLAGWNADERSYRSIFHDESPTAQNFIAMAHKVFGDKAEEFLKLYPATNDQQAKRSAQDLAGDQFIAYSTWKWIELQMKTGQSPVFRYKFEDAPPWPATPAAESRGAYHSSEIEFVFEALPSKNLPWNAVDYKLSEEMASYWTNFAKTGNPNGPGLAKWPAYDRQDGYEVMHLNFTPHAAPDTLRPRYEFLDRLVLKPKKLD